MYFGVGKAVEDQYVMSFISQETKDAFGGCIWRSLRIVTDFAAVKQPAFEYGLQKDAASKLGRSS